jgi:hypothetical protein
MNTNTFSQNCSEGQALLFWSLCKQVGDQVVLDAIANAPEDQDVRFIFSKVINEKDARWHAEQATRRPTDGQVESVQNRLSVINNDPAFEVLVRNAWNVLMDPKSTQADFSDLIDTFERCGITNPNVAGEAVEGSVVTTQAEIIAESAVVDEQAW